MVRDAGLASEGLDVAFAHALLQCVSRGEAPSTLRLHRPRPTVAFGRLDALRPDFAAAARAARAHGFEPVLRAPGGRAAAYHGSSVVLDLAVADPDPVAGVQDRFADIGEVMAGALRSLGVDARVGEVPGEFCPGPHSVNAGGRTKLVGTAQRIVRGGFLFAASVVVRDPEPVRAVLVDVYAALGLEWDPRTVGAVADSVPAVTVAEVEEALAEAFAARHELAPGGLDEAALEAARSRLERHAVAV